MQILVVEDEISLAEAIGELLRKSGYLYELVHDGEDALSYALEVPYDLIILDVMLPGVQGFDVVRGLRKKGVNTPVLILTAKSSVPDKVTGLNAGADDYMTKPFSADELLARVKAMSRRKGEFIPHTLTFEGLSLDLDSCELSCGKKSIRLSRREFEIARMLLNKPSMIISKQTLLLHVWGMNPDATDNNVEAYISLLRKKLKYLGTKVEISTQIMIGYRLEVMKE